MEINNKGFAISGVLYPIFILFIALIFGLVGILASSKSLLDKVKTEIEMELNGVDMNPSIAMIGNDITIATTYQLSVLDGIKAYAFDGKEIGEERIKYTITPSLSVDSNKIIDSSLPGEYNIEYTATDSRGRATVVNRTLRIGTTETYEFAYTGSAATFEALNDGIYVLESWGAEGGGTTEATKGVSLGGKGGYTKGNINLSQGDQFYVFVGQSGGMFTTANIGTSSLYTSKFNGGGSGALDTSEPADIGENGFPGGGATDFRYVKNKIRYVRDYTNGSSANAGNHWVEIEVYSGGVNVASGKPVIGSSAENASYPYSRVTDGITTATSTTYASSIATGLQYVEIDLGAEYEIEYVRVYHYHADGRTYNATKTVLYDESRSFEYEIFDSAHLSTYAETSSGMRHNMDYWNSLGGMKHRIMIAAGGGGGGWSGNGSADQYYAGGGGAGGGLSGLQPSGASSFTVGTQTSGFYFGSGGHGIFGSPPNNNGTGGGGGGYYGGDKGLVFAKPNSSGSGGSSFISGHTGSNAINISGAHTGQPNHFNGFVFTNTVMTAGNASMPNPLGGTQTGHSGNGYARISVLKKINS
jgi:hypothetical protein